MAGDIRKSPAGSAGDGTSAARFLPLNALCLETTWDAARISREAFTRCPLWLMMDRAHVGTVLHKGCEMLAEQLEMPCYMIPVAADSSPEVAIRFSPPLPADPLDVN